MTSPISSTSSDPFKGKTKQEIRELTGQNSDEFLQNSKHVDFNTNLFGGKSKEIIKFVLDEVRSNKLKFSVVNQKENISVLIA